MLPPIFRVALLSTLLSFAPARAGAPPGPPTSPATIPFGLGVNIHFTRPQPGEMEQLAAGGFTFVRMDFDWIRTEKKPGQYDWSAYEGLLKSLKPYGIRAVFILDYANPLYDDNRSPDTDEGRRAFATWAAAAARHFAGRGILWEMYNEPNIKFWRPKPNTDDYIKLALETGKALRAAAPNETYIGPACSTMDFPFLEACFKGGVLEYFQAVSVHPYRGKGPETAASDFEKLRRMIDQYAPAGRAIPIYSGEWGYSSIPPGIDEDRQGRLLSRQWLSNIANNVPLSIWYDWRDDGKDPKENEHHFGTVHNQYHAGQSPVFDPKPAYLAARTLTTQLRDYQFAKRIDLPQTEDYVLVFTRGDDATGDVKGDVKLVAWTTSPKDHAIELANVAGRFEVVSHTGQKMNAAVADAAGLSISVGAGPEYLTPAAGNRSLGSLIQAVK